MVFIPSNIINPENCLEILFLLSNNLSPLFQPSTSTLILSSKELEKNGSERKEKEKEESAFLTVKRKMSNQEGKEEAVQTFHLE